MRVLVIGAGIGGLAAATALRDRDHEVDVIEIKPTMAVYGVGINQPANSLRALRSLGVLDEILAVGFPYDRHDFYDNHGEYVVCVPSGLGGDVPANTALSRGDLHRILGAAAESRDIKVAYDTVVEEMTDDGDGVDVVLSDGRHERYDLVAAFDGISSATRRRIVGPDADAVYSGFGVWRVTLPRPSDVTSTRVYQGVDVKVGFIPLSEQTMYMFVVTPDPEGVRHPKETMAATLRQRMASFSGLPGEVRDALADDAELVYSPISDVLLPLPWFRGRIGILGDAAHACAPHITQGAGMALEDAVVLAECLDGPGSVDDRLRAFEQRRYPRVRLVQDVSRGILEAEMAIDDSNRAAAFEGMRAHLPAQSWVVDEQLNQPA